MQIRRRDSSHKIQQHTYTEFQHETGQQFDL